MEMANLSLYRGPVRGTWKRCTFNADSKRHIKEGFGNGAPGYMKGIWRKGSYTEDSKRYVIKGSGNEAHLTGAP
jgi:hypothetical protein